MAGNAGELVTGLIGHGLTHSDPDPKRPLDQGVIPKLLARGVGLGLRSHVSKFMFEIISKFVFESYQIVSKFVFESKIVSEILYFNEKLCSVSGRLGGTGGGWEKTPDMCPAPRNWPSKGVVPDTI